MKFEIKLQIKKEKKIIKLTQTISSKSNLNVFSTNDDYS